MRLHYWRDGDDEVDFVLRRGSRVVAIEGEERGGGEAGARGGGHCGAWTSSSGRFDHCRRLLVGEGGIPLNEFLTGTAGEWFEEAWG